MAEQGALVVPKVQLIDGGWLFIYQISPQETEEGFDLVENAATIVADGHSIL